MDWGKTLSSEQPEAADLAFLPPVSRPTLVQAAKQRQRSPGAQFRPGQQVGGPDWGPGTEEGRPGCVVVGSPRFQRIEIGWAIPEDPLRLDDGFRRPDAAAYAN
uniref:Uncharacterized protein n=1 Tax=Saimiri boliviensis boliviensis TaxID=39432 RepID=A0A2K6UQM6_SAIBB